MGVMPVKKLLITMSLPMIISMLVQALYNIVDSIFVAQISENALTAVSLAFPLQNLMIAFAGGTAVGVNALLSRSLGEKNKEHVNKTATHAIVIYFITACIFSVIGLTISRPFFAMQTNVAEIVEGGSVYAMIVVGCSFGLFGQFLFERLLQATGRTFHTMITQGLGAIVNIIMDPILIFGWFGFPKMGIAGAALATVIGQCIAMSLALFFNLKFNSDISLKFKGFALNLGIVKQIYSVGLPSIIMQSVGSFMNFSLNNILISFSTTATAVFGVYYKLQSFIFLPIFGLNNGMIPIIAYNYGAKKKERITETIKFSIFLAVLIMSLGTLAFETVPQVLLGLFNASEELIQIGATALRIIAIHFPVAGYCIILGSVFQAMGKGTYSLINSLVRQVIVLLPCAYLLSLTGNLNLVWLAFPIAEVASAAGSTILYQKIKKQIQAIN